MMAASVLVGCGSDRKEEKQKKNSMAVDVDYSGEDPQLEKKVKFLSIWAEDNDNESWLIKFVRIIKTTWIKLCRQEYEMVSADNRHRRLQTLSHRTTCRICSWSRSTTYNIDQRLISCKCFGDCWNTWCIDSLKCSAVELMKVFREQMLLLIYWSLPRRVECWRILV